MIGAAVSSQAGRVSGTGCHLLGDAGNNYLTATDGLRFNGGPGNNQMSRRGGTFE
jgi:hypothetical protein